MTKPSNPKVILFTDMDGTLLDKTYAVTEVKPILDNLIKCGVAIVLASSKTRAEIENYRQNLGLETPFIVENGSAVFIPEGYFKKSYSFTKQIPPYRIIELGVGYATLRHSLMLIQKKTKTKLIGFGDMTTQEIAADCGLPLDLAVLAKNREYDEPFKIIQGTEQKVLAGIKAQSLAYTKGGRYFHLFGNTDKGKATAILKKIFRQEYGKIVTLGVGDGENDLPMLQQVNKPFFIENSKKVIEVWQDILETAKTFTLPS